MINRKDVIIIPLFLSNFKYTNFDFDKLTFRQVNTTIYVDAYYLPSVLNCPIEGINSIIEKIRVNGNGFTNFYRFRNRVIYSVNKNVPLKIK